MKNEQLRNAIRGFKHALAPLIVLFILWGLIYFAGNFTLPEEHKTYETFFLILTVLVSLFLVAITMPCSIYSCYLAVLSIVRDKKYVLPVITLLLDCAVIYAWVWFVRQYLFPVF